MPQHHTLPSAPTRQPPLAEPTAESDASATSTGAGTPITCSGVGDCVVTPSIRPAHHSSPAVFHAHVLMPPVATPTICPGKPGTAVGLLRGAPSPRPSSPLWLRPQQKTPASVTAHACAIPTE